jgi:hypothetical protein
MCAGSAAPAFAVSETEVLRPVTFFEPSCVSTETVKVDGQIRIGFSATVDSRGGLHIQQRYIAQGRGNGFLDFPLFLTPVSTYQVSDEQLQSINIQGPPPASTTSVFNTNVVRLGESIRVDDLVMRSRVHVTMNANGVITAEFDRLTIECR